MKTEPLLSGRLMSETFQIVAYLVHVILCECLLYIASVFGILNSDLGNDHGIPLDKGTIMSWYVHSLKIKDFCMLKD